MGTSKSKSKKPSPTKDGGVSVVANKPRQPASDALIVCDSAELRQLEREFAEASKNAIIEPVRTPESVYGIDNSCDDVPRILRAILEEVMR